MAEATKRRRTFSDNGHEERAEAPAGKLRVKTVRHTDIDSMKASAKQAPSVRLTFKEGEARTVRFLHEPFERRNPWVEYYEHSLQTGGSWAYVPCIEGCKLDGDVRASKRWLVNVWDRDSKAVKLLKLTGAMVENLVLKYERRGTLLDRDYSITRTGEGTDTKYHIEPEDKERFDQRNVKMIDIEGYLDQQAQGYYGGSKGVKARASSIDDDEDEDEVEDEDTDDEDDEEEEPTPRRGAKGRTSSRRQADEEDDDDDDDDDDSDEDEDEEEEKPARRRPVARGRAAARDEDDDEDEDDDDDDEGDDEDEEEEAPRRKTSKAPARSTGTKRPLGRRR